MSIYVMNSQFPLPIAGEMEFAELIQISVERDAATKLLKLREDGLIKSPKALGRDAMLALIEDSSSDNTFAVIDAPWKGGRVVCLFLQNWRFDKAITPNVIEIEKVYCPRIAPVVAVYFSCDWIRALFDIALERSKSLYEAADPRNWKPYSHYEGFFNSPDVGLRWAIAKSWLHWRQGGFEWKQMYASLADLGIADVSIRTLQRKSKMMGLLKNW